MNKHILIWRRAWWMLFVMTAVSFGASYPSEHFIIYSDMDPCYVQIAQANAEAFYDNLAGKYFKDGWTEKLTIYCCRDQAEADQFLVSNGHKEEAGKGYYAPSVPAVYTYAIDSMGNATAWFTLFHGIANHLIYVNSQKGSELFKEQLVYFLGTRSVIVKGVLFFEPPPPGRIPDEKLEETMSNYTRNLFAAAGEGNGDAETMKTVSLFFFSWLDETGKLKTYLYHVYKKDYKLAILEQTAGLRYGQIKDELSAIFRESRMICDYIEQANNSSSQEEKEIALLKALRLKPQNQDAMVETAKFYYSIDDYTKCREMLKPIVIGPPSIHSRAAARLTADAYYSEKNYKAALENYNIALEYSKYYEYKYRLSYQIANCYHYLDDREQAKLWYKEFLDGRWEKDQMTACAEYAAKYIGNSNADTFVTIPSSTTAIVGQ